MDVEDGAGANDPAAAGGAGKPTDPAAGGDAGTAQAPTDPAAAEGAGKADVRPQWAIDAGLFVNDRVLGTTTRNKNKWDHKEGTILALLTAKCKVQIESVGISQGMQHLYDPKQVTKIETTAAEGARQGGQGDAGAAGSAESSGVATGGGNAAEEVQEPPDKKPRLELTEEVLMEDLFADSELEE